MQPLPFLIKLLLRSPLLTGRVLVFCVMLNIFLLQTADVGSWFMSHFRVFFFWSYSTVHPSIAIYDFLLELRGVPVVHLLIYLYHFVEFRFVVALPFWHTLIFRPSFDLKGQWFGIFFSQVSVLVHSEERERERVTCEGPLRIYNFLILKGK